MYIVYLCSRSINNVSPFLEVNGTSIVERICNGFSKLSGCENIFLTNVPSDRNSESLFENTRVVVVPANTMGSAATALYGTCTLNPDSPMWLVCTNEFVDVNWKEVTDWFVENKADVGMLTFKSTANKYSYVKTQGDKVLELAQYNQISNFATTGAFWFRKVDFFITAAKQLIMKRVVVNNQYYVALSINQSILAGKSVLHKAIDRNDYYPAKDMRDILRMEIILNEKD